MRVLVCGVRGSVPAPGVAFTRYGGNTSCVALAHDGEPPTLVLDGGTGLRRLAQELAPRPFRGTILLGHLHWDHIWGLPFFGAAEHPDSDTCVLLPAEGDPLEALAGSISPPHFPLRPDELRGRWCFGRLEPGIRAIEGFSVLTAVIPHLDSTTFGFRVSDATSTVAYLSDHSPIALGRGPEGLGVYHQAAIDLAAGADLLIHDAQHSAAEYGAKAFLGHATVEYAVGLAREANVGALLLYHHDPDRTDDEVDALVAAADGGAVRVRAATEGEVIDLPMSRG